MIEKIKQALYGFRKVLIMSIIITVAIIFRVMDYINGDNFTELIKMSAVAFFASNLGKGIADAIKGKMNNG